MQLSNIVKVLGTPTKEDMLAMNNNYKHIKLPRVKSVPWDEVRVSTLFHILSNVEISSGWGKGFGSVFFFI